MVRPAAAVLVFLSSLGAPGALFAQQTPDPAAQTQQQPSELPSVLSKVKVDRDGGVHFTKHFAVVFGGIKQGSGIAVGPAVSWEPESGEFVQVKAGYSWHHFRLVQARYDSRPLWGKRAVFSTRLRWQDAPKLSLYASGPDSSDRRVEFGARKTEWSGFLKTKVAPKTSVSAGSGVERYAANNGWIDPGEDEVLGEVPVAPGLGTRPWFVHSFASVSNDTRFSPDYSRTGRLLSAGFHDYRDQQNGSLSFERFELAAVQLLPTFRVAGAPDTRYRGALGFFARAWLSQTSGDNDVPFFLMPTLGGGDYLRGYATYRFRDRNAALLGAEYRWAVHKMIDIAGLFEAGTVSPTVGGLASSKVAPSGGVGVRVHSKTAGLLRVDLAGGREGVKFTVGVTTGS